MAEIAICRGKVGDLDTAHLYTNARKSYMNKYGHKGNNQTLDNTEAEDFV